MDDDEIITTKEAVKALFHECGGYKAVAHTLDVSLARVYAFTDAACPEHNISFKRVARLTSPQSPAMARYLAHEAGGVFFPLNLRTGDPLALVGDSARSNGEALAESLSAMADGIVEPGERREVLKQIDEAIRDLASLRAALAATAGDDE